MNMDELNFNIIECESSRGKKLINDLRVSGNTGESKHKNFNILVSQAFANKLEVDTDSQLIFAHIGSHFYIAKKNQFANDKKCYKLNWSGAKGSTLCITNKRLHNMMLPGNYDAGEKILKSGILWYELIHLETNKKNNF